MKRWKCPQCGSGRVGPDTLDAEDSRGFCFPCSDSAGHLVRRVAPAIETAKTKRAERRKRQREAQREREAKREWQRQHTWPGVREVRWTKWSKGLTTRMPSNKMPVVRDATTISAHYRDLFRLGIPGHPTDRRKFCKRIGLDASTVDSLVDAAASESTAGGVWDRAQQAWKKAFAFIGDKAIDWLLEDLGLTEPEAITAVRGAAERCDLRKSDDVASLNTIILNALELEETRSARCLNCTRILDDDGSCRAGCGARDAEGNNLDEPDRDDEDDLLAYEPIGGWQGAH